MTKFVETLLKALQRNLYQSSCEHRKFFASSDSTIRIRNGEWKLSMFCYHCGKKLWKRVRMSKIEPSKSGIVFTYEIL